jgi:hypothetical protein
LIVGLKAGWVGKRIFWRLSLGHEISLLLVSQPY